MRQRSLNHAGSLTTAFLRTLEYYEGMMFLTTNRLTDFDPAMMSRVHIALCYPDLGHDARKKIWESFLERAPKGEVKLRSKELEKLAARNLNGRQVCSDFQTETCVLTSIQIKNAFRAAYVLADGAPVLFSNFETILNLGDEFNQAFQGHGSVESMRSYT
jgi:SpoVK/Ycf46/Vps4 family AAA+-type ATPase